MVDYVLNLSTAILMGSQVVVEVAGGSEVSSANLVDLLLCLFLRFGHLRYLLSSGVLSSYSLLFQSSGVLSNHSFVFDSS